MTVRTCKYIIPWLHFDSLSMIIHSVLFVSIICQTFNYLTFLVSLKWVQVEGNFLCTLF